MTGDTEFDSQSDHSMDDSEFSAQAGIADEVYVFPATFAQKRFWFLDQFEPGSPFYNIPTAVRLKGDFNVQIFRECLNEIVNRHETLRTTFTVMDGEPVQVISPELDLPLTIIDLMGIPEQHRESQAMRIANEEARKPFDLSRGPLLRVILIKIQEQEQIVLLNMHHIVSDGWSMGVLVAEITNLYAAFSTGLPSPLPELPIQYADFAEWQNSWLTGEVLDAQLEYWKGKLGDGVPVLELPTDRPRPAVFSSLGGEVSGYLSKELTEKLKALSRQESVTLFMVLLAGLKSLLSRYTNQLDISIGSPMANRNRAEVEGLIGVFINTLVFRTGLSGNPTFRELLARVRETALNAFANQDLPFEMLVEELHVDRDMSRTPLFQVMLILQNAPAGGEQIPGLSLEPIDIHMGTSTFDLTFSISQTADGMEVSIEYNSDIYDQSTVERMLGHYRLFLEKVVDNPEQRIEEIEFLPADEQVHLLTEWNDTWSDFELGESLSDLTVHELFERRVAMNPENVAIFAPEQGDRASEFITYGELNEKANLLAAYLRLNGVGAETVVGICMDRTPDMFVALLGVMKAGGAYLPLDPVHPQDRLAYMLDDSQIKFLITQDHISELLPGTDADLILLDSEWAQIAQVSQAEVSALRTNASKGDDLVYMIYTSGSTGQSKGVMVEHRSLVNAYLAWERTYGLAEISKHLQMANFTFDVFSGDFVRGLLSGGTLVLCPREWLLDPARLYQLIVDERIECAEFVPAVLRHLVDYLDQNRLKLDTMRVLACGSDSWYVGEYKKFLTVLSSETRLINSFGLTEATIDSTYFEGSLKGLSSDQMVPIGRPFNNSLLYVLDKNLKPCPIGVPGELLIGGMGLARGYHRRELLTAEKFIPNPYLDQLPETWLGEKAFNRLYRTGDMARYLKNGNIEFLGRMDEQLKLRGYRIEPGEIESVLGSHPLVHQAAVLAVELSPGDKRLVAYIEPEGEAEPTHGDLRRHVQQRLPDYMVPSAFEIIKSLPLNASGKIDRRALAAMPLPDFSRRESSEDFVLPSTPVQEKLAFIWGDVLGLAPLKGSNGDGTQPAVGIFDNFFELGGHSLLATQLISRVREAFKIELPLRNIFDSPTVAAFAEHVEIALGSEGQVEVPPILSIPRDPVSGTPVEAVPLSFAQQRLWFLDLLEPNSPFYNLPEAVRLVGPLNESVFEKCLNEIVRRHETLRTTFTMQDGKPIQSIAPQYDVSEGANHYINLQVDDLRGLPIEEREPIALQIAQEEAQRPFNLSKGPLLRARLIRMKGDVELVEEYQSEEDRTRENGNGHSRDGEIPEYIVLLTMHHIIGDNWSSNVLVQELAILYDSLSRGMPDPLPPLDIQYADFSTWQRNWLQGEILQAEIAYWKERLSGSPPLLELPTDRPRPAMQTFAGDYQSFTLPDGLSRNIRDFCQREGITLFMFLLAAFKTLLYRYSGQDDISIGTPIANRNRVEIESLIGFFVNTLVLRTDLSGAPTFRDLMQRVREVSLDAYAHQDLPFEMVVDAVQPERDLSHSPLFQVMFALQSTQMMSQTLPASGLMLSPIEAHSGTSKFDLTLFMIEEEMMGRKGHQYNISGAIEYNTDLFNSETIVRMFDHFERLLEAITEDPDQRIVDIPILSEPEFQQLIVKWNSTFAETHKEICTHQLIEHQAELYPSQLAIQMYKHGSQPGELAYGDRITYGDLNRKANQLAHYLQLNGLNADQLVGLCMDRSVDMVIGLLAIMKAGGAYLPIDPSYPVERLAFMLEDSGIDILLTQSGLVERIPLLDDLAEELHIVRVDRDWDQIEGSLKDFPDKGQENPTSVLAPDNLAYVIYTSGSTGKPKGTMISHRGLVNYLEWVQQAYPIAEGKGAPVHSSISFDLTVTGIFGPLVAGRSVYLLPEGLDVENLGQTIKLETQLGSDPFSLIKITPAHLKLLGEQLSAQEAIDSTHAFIIGGENLLDEHIAFWQKNSPGTQLVNEYGPTETVVGCCVYWAPTGEEARLEGHPGSAVPIGRPIINTQLYILDQYQQPVPVGVPGELYIGGMGVGRGYLKRPELTAERFVPNPFAECLQNEGFNLQNIDRIYRTGDLVRYHPGGEIEFLGRLDFQVKVRGFRVELGEIESILAAHLKVKEAVAWVREDSGFERIVAYIVPESETDLIESKRGELTNLLRKHLGDTLPEYMLPSAYVFLESLPLTPNGKVDRKALPAPEFSRLDQEVEYVAPRSPQEEIIAGIWAEVLGINADDTDQIISVYDNFFNMGGHSLLATQVISRLRDAFDVEIPLRVIFEAPTIAALASSVDQVRQSTYGISAPPIQPLPRDLVTGVPLEAPPLSFAQQRLWFLEQLDPGNPFYNTPAIVRLSGHLDLEALEWSLNTVISRHESLRTTFSDVAGAPVQNISPQLELKLDVYDLISYPESEREKIALEIAGKEASKPFDFQDGPLLGMTLVKINEDEHLALLNMHHIISDEWSMGVFIQELGMLYHHYSLSEDKNLQVSELLPPLPIQYADYAAWQREWLQGEVLENQLNYWRNKLAGTPPLLELPTDRPRPNVQTFWGDQVTFDIPINIAQKIKKLGRDEGATLFMVLLAAFQTLLYRYTNQGDIAIGTPIANRTRAEVEGLIGFFVNTLVMRSDLSGEPGFRDLLKQARDVALGAYAHQDIPFEMLVDELQPMRDMSHSPLFQVMLVLQNAPREALDLTTDLRLRTVEAHNRVARFDLTLSFTESQDGLSGALEYNSDLFDRERIEAMAAHFAYILQVVIENPDTNIAEIQFLNQTEIEQQIVLWNETVNSRSLEIPVHNIFEQQVERTPDATALISEEKSLTYGELNRLANQLANHLSTLGVGLESLVGICMDRSAEMVIGLLGILKAGGAYLPIDPDYPQARIDFMLKDADVEVLLTKDQFIEHLELESPGRKIICLDSDWDRIAVEAHTNPPTIVSGDNLAYVIYTSGSTGEPKGVMLQHRGLNNLVHAQTRGWGVGAHSRVLQFASFSFDASVSEVFMALVTGASLVLTNKEKLSSLPDLLGQLRDQRITIATMPPTLLRELPSDDLPELQTVISAGERCSLEIAMKWSENRQFFNAYGPTEATIGPTYYQVKEKIAEANSVPIGYPIENIQVYILDRYLQPVPIGVPGELFIGGVGLARNYLNRPELTAEKFVPNPFISPEDIANPRLGTRLYRTGDKVRYLRDGSIEFLERIDQQVKVRGFRVELGEIETVLNQHENVQSCVLLAREDIPGHTRIVAYIVPVASPMPSIDELRSFLLKMLPDYMLPSFFIEIEKIPLTPNAKVDRKALPAPDLTRPELGSIFIAPRNPVEGILVSIWSDVLGLETTEIGVQDNFFALGGHSLLATQIMSRVADAFKVEVPLRSLFDEPTVEGIATAIEIMKAKEPVYIPPPMQPLSRDEKTGLPVEAPELSFAQQRMWFLYQLEPEVPFYNLPGAFRLRGKIDLDAFESSVNGIIRRHEVLRTTFETTAEGKSVQVIHADLKIAIPLIDLSELSEVERTQELLRFNQEVAQQPFELEKLPLIRISVIRLAQDDHVVLFNMHHIISDGWSLGIFARELILGYEALVNEAPITLPALPIQYADFASWQRNWLKGPVLEEQLNFWKSQLSGSSPILDLPTDRPRPPVQTFKGMTLSFDLDNELSSKVRHFSQDNEVTLFMTLLAAFQSLLYRYTGQEDISVGTPIANRTRADIEGLIGFFVNTLVIRTDFSGSPSFQEILLRVRDFALGAYTHQDIPFEMLVDKLEVERDLSYTPLFQVVFTLQEAPAELPDLSDIQVGSLEAETGIAKFDITLSMIDDGNQISGSIEFNTDLFDPETIERMIDQYQKALEVVVGNPGIKISHIPLISSEARTELINSISGAYKPHMEELTLHEWFESIVDRYPDRIALVYEDQILTYRELNHRANQLANFLRELGIRPDNLVGLFLDRSLEMVISILAILKAGGAYLPIDLAYPDDRRDFMLEDAGARVLITHSSLLESISVKNLQIIQIDQVFESIKSKSTQNLDKRVSRDNLAYVIYTSGSTGKPKGVMVTHANVVRLFTATDDWYGFDENDVWTLFHSYAFDFSVWELWGALLYGGRLVIVPFLTSRSPETFYKLLCDEKVTVLNQTPSAFRQLIRAEEEIGQSEELSLRYVIFGGEALDFNSLKPWYDRHDDKNPQLINMYGITETTVHVTYRPISLVDIENQSRSVIGGPIPDLQLYILDQNQEPVPVGIPGELCVGGDGLARGYLKRPGLTSQKFITNPFINQPGNTMTETRLYRSGDLARYLPNGDIEFIGRIDHQVKIRGFRIELGEIEATISNHPFVRETVAIVREDVPGDKRLVVYVSLSKGSQVDVVELRKLAEDNLPEYMVPSAIMILDVLPLTPNGKLDRRALPAPELTRIERDREFVLPRNEQEEDLAAIWIDVLGIKPAEQSKGIGVFDNFFEMGGDSILAIQMIARAKQAGFQITPKLLFQHPTIDGLLRFSKVGEELVADQDMITGELPLTPIQNWFFKKIVIDRHHWNTSMLLEFFEPLEVELLRSTIKILIEHHDALRTEFRETENGWQQVITPPKGELPFEYVDFSDIEKDEVRVRIAQKTKQIQTSFELANGPLMWVIYFDLGRFENPRLFFVFHHLIMDGVSWRIFLEDFQGLYRQFAQGMEPQLPPKTISYKKWAGLLSDYAQSEEMLEEISYWQRLGDIELGEVPVDNPGGDNTFGKTREITYSLTESETQALLREIPGEYNAQINDILLTALVRTFVRITGRRNLLIEMEGHGREEIIPGVDLTRTIGWFTTIFPVLLDIEGVDGIKEEIAQVKEQLASLPNHGIGFGILKELSDDIGVRELLSNLPEPAINFNYLGQFEQSSNEEVMSFRMGRESVGDEQSPKATKPALLYIVCVVSGGSLHLRWLYSQDMYRKRTINRMANIYIEEIRNIIATVSPDRVSTRLERIKNSFTDSIKRLLLH